MKIGVIGAGTMGQGIAKAFAQVEGNTVALCDIKQEWAETGLWSGERRVGEEVKSWLAPEP